MATEKPSPSSLWSRVLRCSLAVLSVVVAVGISLFLFHHKVQGVEFPILLITIALTVWYLGIGPAILALALAIFSFDYYFTEPYHSLYVSWKDIPYYVIFVLFALLIAWFAAVRRRVEQNLRQSRDDLQREVAVRTQQANLLNLTHDTIFVRIPFPHTSCRVPQGDSNEQHSFDPPRLLRLRRGV